MIEISEDDVHVMRKEGSLGEFIRQQLVASKERAARRRLLVLGHEDLALKLTEQPMNFTRAEQWDGSVPPERFNGAYNDSPRRPAVLALVAEAERREAAKRRAERLPRSA